MHSKCDYHNDDYWNRQYNNQIPEDFIEAFKQNFCGGSTKDSLGDEDTQKNGENIESSEKKTNKRGRKKKTDKTQRKHNKFSFDNRDSFFNINSENFNAESFIRYDSVTTIPQNKFNFADIVHK